MVETTPNIQDFPLEILRTILKHVVDRDNWQWYEDTRNEPERRTAVLRLVCRKFHDASSDLLIQCVHIGLNKRSLQRLEEIMHHPQISQGVQAIHVDLSYYAADVAQSIQNFKIVASNGVQPLAYNLKLYIERQSTGNSSVAAYTTADLVKLKNYVTPLSEEWWTFRDTDTMTVNKVYPESQQLLLDAYVAYTAKFNEQEYLLQNNRFLDLLSSLLRGHNITNVCFGREKLKINKIDYVGVIETIQSRERLINHITGPHQWHVARDRYYARPPADVPFILPVNFREHDIKIERFQHHKLFPHLIESKWAQGQSAKIREAFSSIQMIDILIGSTLVLDTCDQTRRDILQQYAVLKDLIAPMMTSPRLQEARLNFSALYESYDSSSVQTAFSLIMPTYCPVLEKLELTGFAFHAQEFVTFITLPENAKLKNLKLYKCRLLTGKWREVVQEMKDRSGVINFEIHSPFGGEMDGLAEPLAFEKWPCLITKYMNGQTDVNPFDPEHGKVKERQ